MAEPWINPRLTANHIQDNPTTPSTRCRPRPPSPSNNPPPSLPPPPLIALALISRVGEGGGRGGRKDEGRIRLIRRAPGMRLKEGNCAPFSPAFCDIYIEGVGAGAGGRDADIRGDATVAWRRPDFFWRWLVLSIESARFIINDPPA